MSDKTQTTIIDADIPAVAKIRELGEVSAKAAVKVDTLGDVLADTEGKAGRTAGLERQTKAQAEVGAAAEASARRVRTSSAEIQRAAEAAAAQVSRSTEVYKRAFVPSSPAAVDNLLGRDLAGYSELVKMRKDLQRLDRAGTLSTEELERAEARLMGRYQAGAEVMRRSGLSRSELIALDEAGRSKALAAAEALEAETRAAMGSAGALEAHAGATRLSYSQQQQLSAAARNTIDSLAAGIPVQTVLMTQGTQLAGALSEQGTALRLLASPMAAAVIGVGALAGAMAVALTRASTLSSELRRLRSASIAYSNDALRPEDMRDSAYGVAAGSSFSRGDAVDAAGSLVRARDLSSEQALAVQGVSADFAKATERDLSAAVDTLTGALRKGYEGVADLDRAYGFLNPSQRETIRGLYETGRAADASRLAIWAFTEQMDRAADVASGTAADAFREMGNAWNDALDAMAESPAMRAVLSFLETAGRGAETVFGGTGGGGAVDPLAARYSAAHKEVARLRGELEQLERVNPQGNARAPLFNMQNQLRAAQAALDAAEADMRREVPRREQADQQRLGGARDSAVADAVAEIEREAAALRRLAPARERAQAEVEALRKQMSGEVGFAPVPGEAVGANGLSTGAQRMVDAQLSRAAAERAGQGADSAAATRRAVEDARKVAEAFKVSEAEGARMAAVTAQVTEALQARLGVAYGLAEAEKALAAGYSNSRAELEKTIAEAARSADAAETMRDAAASGGNAEYEAGLAADAEKRARAVRDAAEAWISQRESMGLAVDRARELAEVEGRLADLAAKVRAEKEATAQADVVRAARTAGAEVGDLRTVRDGLAIGGGAGANAAARVGLDAQARGLAGGRFESFGAMAGTEGFGEAAERMRAAAEEARRLNTELSYLQEIKGPSDELPERLRALDELHRMGALSAEEFGRAANEAHLRALESATDFESGAERALRGYIQSVGTVADQTERLMSNAFKGMEDALVNFATTGKLNFTDLANSIISDLIRMQIQASITKPLFGLLGAAGEGILGGLGGMLGFEQGGVMDQFGPVDRFATGGTFTNSVVAEPTLFKFAQGAKMGLMGEAGPEAIVPLTRGPNGDLGIQSFGGGAPGAGGGKGVNVEVYDQRTNSDASPIEVEQDFSGLVPIVRIIARDEANKRVESFAREEMPKSLRGEYRLARPPVARG